MQFNVSALLKEHTGATREYDIDDDIRIDGEKHHIAGHVRLDRTPDGVLVRAKISSSMEGVCSRCLKPLTYPIDLDVEEEYVPTIDVNTGTSVQPPHGAEDAFRINARHVLDLSQAVSQYWAMALPMAPLCEENCAGLCPLCGEEIAAMGHECTREQVDARWSKLAQLKLS